jgi:Arc/MetJ family transcription regulator
MCRPRRLLGVVAALVATMDAGPSRANGGPVQLQPSASARGGIVPTRVKDVRLIAEDLRIVLEEDGEHYRVHAKYVLSNPKGRRQIQFGVPLAWGEAYDDELPDDHPRRAGPRSRKIAAAARSVRIAVNDQLNRCRPLTGTSRKITQVPVIDMTVLPRRGPPPDLSSLATSESFGSETWCVAELTLPASNTVSLTLSYRGVLEHFSDWPSDVPGNFNPYDYGPPTFFAPRTLRYALFPAGYWGGPAKRVSITIDAGVFAGLVQAIRPSGARATAGTLVWRLTDVDLAKSHSLVVEVDVRPVLRRRELVGWNGRRKVELRARASEPTAPSRGVGSEAAKAIDGSASTAWCSGGLRTGRQPWIEVQLLRPPRLQDLAGRPASDYGCTLRGIAVLPGHGQSLTRYRRSGRATRLRVGACGSVDAGFEVTLHAAERHDRSAQLIELGCDLVAEGYHNPFYGQTTGSAFGEVCVDQSPEVKTLVQRWASVGRKRANPAPCLRVTILDATPAPNADVCIGEIAPVLICCDDEPCRSDGK